MAEISKVWPDAGALLVRLYGLLELSKALPEYQALAQLHEAERLALRRMDSASRYRELLYGRVQLRRDLAAWAGVAVEEICFQSSPLGKPRAATQSGVVLPAFNVSHANGLLAIALARDGDIGVDLEQETPAMAEEILSIARGQFAPAEYQQLLALSPEARPACFFRQWTLKEAMAKAIGAGFALALDQLDVAGTSSRICRALPWQDRVLNLHAQHLRIGSHWHLAAARVDALSKVDIQVSPGARLCLEAGDTS